MNFPTEDNWDSYGAKATTPEAIASARSVAFVPTVSGGVLIEHDGFAVEILPDGSIDPNILIGGEDYYIVRADPALAAELLEYADEMDGSEWYDNRADALRADARIIGGEK